MKTRELVFNAIIALVVATIAKAFGRQIAELSWTEFFIDASLCTIAASLGAYVVGQLRTNRHSQGRAVGTFDDEKS